MISTVASPISPVLAETPIARPSAKLCRPIAAAIVMPVRSACVRAWIGLGDSASACSTVIASVEPPAIGGWSLERAHAALDHRQPGAAGGEAAAEQEREAERLAEARLVVLEALDRVLDDPERVLEHVDEQERQDADREHRQADPGAVAEQLQPPERQAQVDRETGERSEDDCLGEAQGKTS